MGDNIKLYVLLVSLQYLGVNSRNIVVHVPKGMDTAKAIDDIMLRVVKPLRTVAGSSNRRVDIELIMPRLSKIDNQEAHKAQRSHSIARQLQNVNTPTYTNFLRTGCTSSTKRLAYKSDLIKALEDLKKRQATKCSNNNKSCPYNKTTESRSVPRRITTKSFPKKIKNINDLNGVIELIKSGLHVNRNVNKPARENVEWMKIKIPKH